MSPSRCKFESKIIFLTICDSDLFVSFLFFLTNESQVKRPAMIQSSAHVAKIVTFGFGAS